MSGLRTSTMFSFTVLLISFLNVLAILDLPAALLTTDTGTGHDRW